MSGSAAAGEAACLCAAALWAFTVSLFRVPIEEHGARAINLAKCVIAAVLLGATTWLMGQGGVVANALPRHVALIAASGLVGLTFGDTALFASVRRIGPYRALLLQTMAPVFTAGLAFAWQGESLGGTRVPGMILTMTGVGLVVSPAGGAATPGAAFPSPGRLATPAKGGGRLTGVVMGVLAALGQAGGIVLAKAGMSDVPFLPASMLRLATAAAGLILVGLLDGRLTRSVKALSARRTLDRVVPAAFLGSYVGILLMMAGVASAPASVAAVLLSTTPVFSLVLDVSRRRERFTVRNVAGTALAFSGVVMITAG